LNKAQRGLLIFVVALVLAVVFCAMIPLGILPSEAGLGVALPVITLPGEALIGSKENPTLTNTFLTTLIADVVVLGFVFLAVRRLKDVPGRLQGLLEMIWEGLYGLARSIAGDKAKRLFPMMMSIFLLILAANWLKLLPGVESVGLMHCAEPGMTGYDRQGVFLNVREPLGGDGQVATEADYHACEEELHGEAHEVVAAEEATNVEAESDAHEAEAAGEETHAEGEAITGTPLYVVTPFLRGPATDLNFTFALAVVVMVSVQVWGFRALGGGYLYKFFNFPALGNLRKNPLGIIDFGVGLLEIISEIGKIISLSFRLFGNLFAGGMLLIVVSFLVAWILPVAVYGLELFIGAIQAFVFAMLYLVFSAGAMESHHGDEDEHH
jgi:F-type H+-transporting ATPase subunit a